MGGISTDDYSNGQLTETAPGIPGPAWVDDVSSLVQRKNGSDQEYIMPPLPGLYGAHSGFMANPVLPEYSNGVIRLNKLKLATALGYIYGGNYSTVTQTGNTVTQTDASNEVFQVRLTPTR
jgi:hypothetical protein